VTSRFAQDDVGLVVAPTSRSASVPQIMVRTLIGRWALQGSLVPLASLLADPFSAANRYDTPPTVDDHSVVSPDSNPSAKSGHSSVSKVIPAVASATHARNPERAKS